MRNDLHTPNLAASLGRRRDDEPITETDFAAIGRAAHAELLRRIETKDARRREQQAERERESDRQPARERSVARV